MCAVCRKPKPNPSLRILSPKQYAAKGFDLQDYNTYLRRRHFEVAAEKLRILSFQG